MNEISKTETKVAWEVRLIDQPCRGEHRVFSRHRSEAAAVRARERHLRHWDGWDGWFLVFRVGPCGECGRDVAAVAGTTDVAATARPLCPRCEDAAFEADCAELDAEYDAEWADAQ